MTLNAIVSIGYSRAEAERMTWSEVQGVLEAQHVDENERLVMLMNVIAVGYGGTAKTRKQMADTLLGTGGAEFDIEAFESIFAGGNLATSADDPATQAIKEWGIAEFDMSDPAFKISK